MSIDPRLIESLMLAFHEARYGEALWAREAVARVCIPALAREFARIAEEACEHKCEACEEPINCPCAEASSEAILKAAGVTE
jgi:hypothetical protein